jgi:hypothetical protein
MGAKPMSELTENDHAFFVESDIVKLTESEDRLLVEGWVGKIVAMKFVDNSLEILGLEGKLKITLNEKEFLKLLNPRSP